MHINGNIDARLLPSPVIKLHNVEAGEPGRRPQLRAGMLKVEVGLGPLLRGEDAGVRSAAHCAADRDSGSTVPARSSGPRYRRRFVPRRSPSRASRSRTGVSTFTDAASGSRHVLQKLWFNGEIRSIVGPFKGEGAFVVGDELFGYRVSGGRADGDALQIRLGVDPSNHPLTTESDGTLTLDQGVPQFAGTLASRGRSVPRWRAAKRMSSEPWRAEGKIKTTPASASLRTSALRYGPDERAVNFSGSAELKFGAASATRRRVAALRVDVDRALAAPDLTHRPPLLELRSFFEGFVACGQTADAGAVRYQRRRGDVGGTTIQSLHGDIDFDETGWSLNRFEFRAPGLHPGQPQRPF